MKPWNNISACSVYIQLGTLALIAGSFLFRYKRFGSINFRLQVMGILMTWMVLFSNAADTHTYLIAMLGYMLWYFSQDEHKKIDMVLFYTLLVVVVIVPIDIICPPFIMRFLFRKLSLHLWLVTINFLRMCYVTLINTTTDFSNKPKLNKESPATNRAS